MADASSGNPAQMADPRPSWPWLSLVVSVLLWLLAWEAIVWFVPVRPRLVIRNPDDSDAEGSLYLTGFSPDGRSLVTAVEPDPNMPGQIYRLWDVETGQDLGIVGSSKKTILPNVVYCCQKDLVDEVVFPIKPLLDPSYTLYDLATGQETATIQVERNEGIYTVICFSIDGRTLACCTNTKAKGDLKLIDVPTGEVRAHFEGWNYTYSRSWVFSQDGRNFAIAATKHDESDHFLNEQKVFVLDTRTGNTRWILQNYGETRQLSFSPDGTKLATFYYNRDPKSGFFAGRIKVWDMNTGDQLACFKAEGDPEFLPDGKGLAIRDGDCVRFCDAMTGKEFAVADVSPNDALIPVPDSHLVAVPAMHHSKPSLFFKWCATCLGIKSLGKESDNDQLTFLDARTGAMVATIPRETLPGGIKEFRISPDGETLAMDLFKPESIIEVWDIPPRKPLRWVLGLLAIPSVVTAMTLVKFWRRLFQSRAI